MEKPKPAQSLEQKQETPEDYVVATFPVDTDPDNARRPLTVIRSSQDGEGVKYDRGWNPIDMSVVCDTDSEEGIGPIKLLMEAYKLVETDIKTEFVPLEDIQGLNEDYIKYLYGKTPKEMIEEAKQIWRQKHPDSRRIESLAPGVGSDSDSGAESPSSSSVEDTSGHEKSLADKVGPVMGSMAVKATGIKKPIDTNKAETNEPVEKDKTGVGSSALKIPESTMELIRATEVNGSVGSPAVEPAKKPVEIDKVGANPADLVATEPVEKLVEVDKATADLVDLPAVESAKNPVVEKSMETNETNTDILPEDFKIAIDSFKQLTEDNNNQFFAKAQYIAGELDRLRGLIKYNPTAMNNPAISEMITSESGRIRDLEASRAESVNKFKNDINSLLEGLKNEIENEDEKRRRLVKLTEHVDQMGVDNTVLGEATSGLLDKLIRIRRYIEGWQNDRWGADGYKSNISQVIDEIVNDLSIASGRRRGIVGDVEVIKREGYYQER